MRRSRQRIKAEQNPLFETAVGVEMIVGAATVYVPAVEAISERVSRKNLDTSVSGSGGVSNLAAVQDNNPLCMLAVDAVKVAVSAVGSKELAVVVAVGTEVSEKVEDTGVSGSITSVPLNNVSGGKEVKTVEKAVNLVVAGSVSVRTASAAGKAADRLKQLCKKHGLQLKSMQMDFSGEAA